MKKCFIEAPETLLNIFCGGHKGQLISKCPFGLVVWTKITTKFFPGFLPLPLKRCQIKKNKGTLYT